MTTKHTASHSHATHAAHPRHAPAPAAEATTGITEAAAIGRPLPLTSPPAPPAVPAGPTGSGATGGAAGATGATAGALTLPPPPSTANIPAVPANFNPQNGANYRGVAPKTEELNALQLAVDDLKRFTSFSQVLGATVPPYEVVLALFIVVNEWSSMRTASTAWDGYARVQDGIGWTLLRTMMAVLTPAFRLAATTNTSLTLTYPGLATLLGVKKSIARKGVSTKRLNKQAKAEGKPQVHGAVGKKRQKAAEKAALVTVTSNGGAGSSTAPTAPAEAQPEAAPVAEATVAQAAVAPTQPVAPQTPVVAAPQVAANVTPGTAGVAPLVNGAGTASH
jgi:hypothetical protein